MARGPVIQLGHAQILVEGRRVRLGTEPRPEAERQAHTSQAGAVSGRLVIKPPLDQPAHVAQLVPPPTLYDISDIQPAR